MCSIKVRGVIGDELAREGIDIVTLSDSGEQKAYKSWPPKVSSHNS